MTIESPLTISLYLGFLPLLFMIAGIFDLLTGRIPDLISILLLIGFFIFAFLSDYSLFTFSLHIGLGFLVFFLGFLAFSLGWIGGGDGKLAAAGAIWFGPETAFDFFTLSFVYGAGLVFIVFVLRRIALPPLLFKQDWLMRWVNGKDGLPFGLAMAAAVLTLIR